MRASAVLYVGNLGVMRDFYEACFDLTVADDAKAYCSLESDSWALMLVQSTQPNPATSPPPRRAATPVKLAFDVRSIEAVRPVMDQLGGLLDPDRTTWKFKNTLRCDCTDPEGNVVQLVQSVDSD